MGHPGRTVLALAAAIADPSSGVGVLAALAAGVVSFLSPCVLPLVPGYLSAVSGIRPSELEAAPLAKVLAPSLLFVLSFSAIFIALGLGATKLGSSLNDHIDTLETISGVVIIVLGLFFLATPFVAQLNREWHLEGLMARAGAGGPVLAGAAFAIAWTPCIGPTLGAILSAAALSQTTGRGAYLLAWYSAGLAIPFLLTAVAFNRMTTLFAAVKRHYGVIVAAGGAILVVMGVLIVTGELTQLNIEAQKLLDRVGLDFLTGI
jgi:cytochrome c-type biogenesis protein